MGAGLGFPVGDSAALRFHPQPPINKINDLMNAAKFEYFLKKYQDYENQSTTTKRGHSKNAYYRTKLKLDREVGGGFFF